MMHARPWLVCALLIGCDSERPTEPNDAAVMNESGVDAVAAAARTVRDACLAQRDVLCHEFERCASLDEKWRFASEAECRARLAARCQVLAELPGVLDPIAIVDGCTRAIEPVRCATEREETYRRLCLLSNGGRGTLPEASACRAHAQCASGWCNGAFEAPLFGRCGRCAMPAEVGDDCGTDRDCRTRDGSRRLLTCDGGRCALLPRDPLLGEACDGARPCVNSDCVDGICVAGSLPLGADCSAAACSPTLVCREGICGRGDAIELVGVGVSCADSMEAEWTIHRLCRGDAWCSTRVCQPAKRLGDGCASSFPLQCFLGRGLHRLDLHAARRRVQVSKKHEAPVTDHRGLRCWSLRPISRGGRDPE